MNQMTTVPAERATLVDIRTDNRKFPRLHTYRREDAIAQMNMIIMMAFQYRGQQADAQTIFQMSSSLIDILNEDEYGIGTKFLSFEEIKRVVKKAALGQSREMYGISVSSIFQALADYCKGEGKVADKEAKQIASKQKELRNSIIAPMIQGYAETMVKQQKK
ncbi:MAG: hypothetical protein IIW66_01655 [Bacteroidales bacterium]|nr:hypothetical protein [Bacteroidales bacterium]